ICVARAVAHHVETKLAVCTFDWKVRFAFWSPDSMPEHDQFELLHEPFDVAVRVFFGRKEHSFFFCCNGLVLRAARALERWTGHTGVAGEGFDVADLCKIHHLRGRDRMTCLRVDQYGTRWNIAERLLHDAHGLFHLLHAYEVTIHIVPARSDGHVK